MLNRPLSRRVTGLAGRRLMADGRRRQYRGRGGKVGLTWHVLSQISLISAPTSGAEPHAPVDGRGGGAGPKNTPALAINDTTQAREATDGSSAPPRPGPRTEGHVPLTWGWGVGGGSTSLTATADV